MKVLIIDDEAINRMVLSHIFEDRNDEVLFAENGLEALKILKTETKIDILLLDLNMPVMDGYELMRHLETAFFKDLDFKLIVISASLESDFYEKSKQIGLTLKRMDFFIGKPVNLNYLYSIVIKLLPNGQ
ncbi:MAG: response regulator [Bacteroidetes bacterium]|nr:response regulator [Bacteroidota bacterium]